MFQTSAPYDVVIHHARIVDGTGSPWYYADLGVRGDTIAAIGDLRNERGLIDLDARDTFSRLGIFLDPMAQNYIRQGVTTLMEGLDGSSPLPLALRHSRETTHLCSPKVTHQNRCSAGRFGLPRHAAGAAG